MLHAELTQAILAVCFEVSNELGAGFLESVYQNALDIAFKTKKIIAMREHPIEVTFRGQNVGQFYADFFIEEKVILEVKAVTNLSQVHKAQIINYLKAGNIDVGLLVNFGTPKIEYRRFDNKMKQK